MAMFVNDRPIEKKKDDQLSRSSISINLAKSIIGWRGKDSLVIALYGKWGSGKSSVINLAREEIEQSADQKKPTVIEFNPWLFSGEDKLNEHFFDEIALFGWICVFWIYILRHAALLEFESVERLLFV